MKLECLRLLVTLRLDPGRMRLISGFIDSYLRLNAQEELLFEQQAITLLDTTEQAKVMELTTSWEEKGIEIGRREGQQEGLQRERRLILRMLRKRWGPLPPESEARIDSFSFEQLDALGEASVDFTSIADLKTWLSAH